MNRPFAIYLSVCSVCVGLGAVATWQIHRREAAVRWTESQITIQEQSYATTLQERYSDGELASLGERRSLVLSTAGWFQLRLGCLLLLGLASFAFYLQQIVSSFTEEIVEPTGS